MLPPPSGWVSDRNGIHDDPPSKLIGQFLHKQKKSGGGMSLDMDLEMAELRSGNLDTRPLSQSPATARMVSFHTPIGISVELEGNDIRDSSSENDGRCDRKSHSKLQFDDSADTVVRCSGSSSFQRRSSMLRMKTRSRLLDPPEKTDRRTDRIPKSGQLKSGFMGRPFDEEEEDPFTEEDLPEEYKKDNSFNTLTLLQWLSLVAIVAALACSLSIPTLKSRTLWELQLWKWDVMVLVLICGRLVSGWVIRMAVFFIERNFLLRKRVLYFVYGLRKSVQNCLWLGLVLIAWHILFDKKVQRERGSKTLEYVTKILVCFLVGTLLWLVKTFMVKVLASSFHVSTYFDRIQESLFNQYVIEKLSGPPLIELNRIQEEEERTMVEICKLQNAGATIPPELKAATFSTMKSSRVIGNAGFQKCAIEKGSKLSAAVSRHYDDKITIDHLHKLNTNNVSAWNMKRLMNIVKHGALSTLDEQIENATQYDEHTTQIRSEIQAKTAARKIFQNVSKPGKRFITLQDLLSFMEEEEALKTMSLFEGATESNKISRSALKNWVVNAFRDRRALSLTLNDTKTAVNKLHHIINIVVSITIMVIWLLILGIATTKFLVLISSQLLLVAFIFGNTCKTVFESIIFLFVIHPFDVGDRCEIDAVQMIVEEMNILTTVFLRYDNLKIIYPNSVLLMKPIYNYYRSPDMGDAIDFCIHISTPGDKIALMKQRITCLVESKKEHWCPAPMIVLKEVEDMNRLNFGVWLCHRINHQDMGERWSRRALLIDDMIKIFKELDVQYRMLPIDIHVRSLPSPSPAAVVPPPSH